MSQKIKVSSSAHKSKSKIFNELSLINKVSNRLSREKELDMRSFNLDSLKGTSNFSFNYNDQSQFYAHSRLGKESNLLDKRSHASMLLLEKASADNDANFLDRKSSNFINAKFINLEKIISNQKTKDDFENPDKAKANLEIRIFRNLAKMLRQNKLQNETNPERKEPNSGQKANQSISGQEVVTGGASESQRRRGYHINWDPPLKNQPNFRNLEREIKDMIDGIIKKHQTILKKSKARKAEYSDFDQSFETLKIFKSQKKENTKSFCIEPEARNDSIFDFDSFQPPVEYSPSVDSKRSKMRVPKDLSELPTLPSSSKKLVQSPGQKETEKTERCTQGADDLAFVDYRDYLGIFTQNSVLNEFADDTLAKQFHASVREAIQESEKKQKVAYTPEQLIFYFRSGLWAKGPKLTSVSKQTKFKLIFYFIGSFLDLDEAFAKFENFDSFSELKRETAQRKLLLIDIYEKSQDQCSLEQLFFARDTKDPERIMEQQGFTSFFKKILIVMLGLIDLMKIFVNRRAGEPIFAEKAYYDKYKLVISNTLPDQPLRRLQVDSSVLTMSIDELIGKIRLEDVLAYFTLNNAFIKKRKKRQIYFSDGKGEAQSIVVSNAEQAQYFCHRFKRPFISRKFLFKFIKNRIFSEYKESTEKSKLMISQKELKQRFKREFFQNEDCYKLYNSENINKKTLTRLASNSDRVIQEMGSFVGNRLMGDLVARVRHDEAPPMFNKFLTFTTFGHFFLHHLKKKPMVLEECFRELRVFTDLFQSN